MLVVSVVAQVSDQLQSGVYDSHICEHWQECTKTTCDDCDFVPQTLHFPK